MSDADEVPSAEAANQAVNVVVTGKHSRARVNVATAQTSGTEATAAPTTAPEPAPEDSGFWTRSRRIGVFIAGVAGVVAAVVTVIEFVH